MSLITKMKKITIDLDKDPFIPQGWKLESHKKMGKWEFKPELWLHEKQKSGYIENNYLIKGLPDNILNANVLDFLLKHPYLIPDESKPHGIFFWGTIYRYSDGELCVRVLRWDGDKWGWVPAGWWTPSPPTLRLLYEEAVFKCLKSRVEKVLKI